MGVGKDLWNESERLGNKHDWAGVASLMTTDAVYSSPAGRHEGRDAIRAYLEAGDNALPDQTGQTSLVIEDGDTVVAEWTFRGTHTGPLPVPDGTDIPATGKTVELSGVTISEIRDGKLVSMREYFDNAALMTQLGLMPGSERTLPKKTGRRMGTGKDLWNQYETLLNNHDSGVASLYASDGVYVDPRRSHEGPEAIEAYLAAWDKAFPDSSFEASLLLEEADVVVAEWTIAGNVSTDRWPCQMVPRYRRPARRCSTPEQPYARDPGREVPQCA